MEINEVKNKINEINNGEYILMDKIYKNNKILLNILHKKCNNIFKMSFNDFYNHGYRCKYCSLNNKKVGLDKINSYLEENYKDEYKLISTNYINNKEKLKFLCIKCNNIFEKSWDSFRRRPWCQKCRKEENNKKLYKSNEEFLNEVYKKFGNEYTILSKYEHNKKKIKIKRNKCNHIFDCTPNNFLTYNITNYCPKCNSSKPECFIRTILENNNIKFEEQKTFKDLKNINLLRFDFCIYLNDNDFILLEYDGINHFKDIHHNNQLDIIQKRDKLKNDYCNKNKIPLYRIQCKENNNDFKKIENEMNLLLKNIIKK